MSLSPLSCVVDSPRVVSCSETVVEAFCLCVLNSFPAGDIGLWLVMIIARLPELAAWHVIVTDKKCEIKYLSVSSSTLLSVHRQTIQKTRCYGQLNKCTMQDTIQQNSVASECEVRA
jgi:hypothetical protein